MEVRTERDDDERHLLVDRRGGEVTLAQARTEIAEELLREQRLKEQARAAAQAAMDKVKAGAKLAEFFPKSDSDADEAKPKAGKGSRVQVEETGVGATHPFSGEKLSPVLAVYRARDFAHATALAASILRYQGAGHSVGLHSKDDARALALGLELPVCRVIVNQAHCFATGGSFDRSAAVPKRP